MYPSVTFIFEYISPQSVYYCDSMVTMLEVEDALTIYRQFSCHCCSGTIAGLIAATPASGFIHPWAAVIMGVISGALCNYTTKCETTGSFASADIDTILSQIPKGPDW